MNITEKPTWSSHTSTVTKEAQKRLYFLMGLKKPSSCRPLQRSNRKPPGWKHHRQTRLMHSPRPEGSAVGDWNGRNIISTHLRSIGEGRVPAWSLKTTPTLSSYSLFTLLTSGRRLGSTRCLSTRLQSSFLSSSCETIHFIFQTPLQNCFNLII